MIQKKLRNICVLALLFLVTAEIAAVASNYWFFEKVAKKEAAKRSMPVISANAIKHAYTASLVYSTLRTLFISEDVAKNITIFLGKTNEIAETIFKPRQDSTLEMMKDLSNNLIGICAGKLIEENHNNPAMDDRLSVIGSLAERKMLILSRADVPASDVEKEETAKSYDYLKAARWFDENQEKISCNF